MTLNINLSISARVTNNPNPLVLVDITLSNNAGKDYFFPAYSIFFEGFIGDSTQFRVFGGPGEIWCDSGDEAYPIENSSFRIADRNSITNANILISDFCDFTTVAWGIYSVEFYTIIFPCNDEKLEYCDSEVVVTGITQFTIPETLVT